MQTRVHRFALLPLLLTFLLAGCQTYGAYGSEEAYRQKIVEANRVFAAELDRNRAEAATLTGDPMLSQAFAETVSLHEAYLADHQRHAENLANSSDYRTLSRTYGSIVAEQQIIRDRYAALAGWRSTADTLTYTEARAEDARYYVVPPAYARITNQLRPLSVSESVRGGRTGLPQGPGVGEVAPASAAGTDTTANVTADTAAVQQ